MFQNNIKHRKCMTFKTVLNNITIFFSPLKTIYTNKNILPVDNGS